MSLSGGSEKRKMMKKRWVKIAVIALAVVLIASFAASVFFYWRMKHSVIGELGIHRALELEGIRLETWDQRAPEQLDMKDRWEILWILSHTRKYDKSKDQVYLPDGYYIYDPYIAFQKKGEEETECGIYWDYLNAKFYYYPSDTSKRKNVVYYLDECYAQALRDLFEKYIKLSHVPKDVYFY